MFAQIESILQKIGAVLLAIVGTFSSLLGLGPGGIPEEAATEDTLCYTIAIVSDTHIDNAAAAAMLDAGLRDISADYLDTDAVLFLGDCTDNGNIENWETFTNSVTKNCTVENKIVILGNHDTWTSYDTPHDYDEALNNYLTYSNAIMGTNHTTPYFTCEFSGYSFIVLASEDTSVSAEVSDEQLSWADEQLAAAAAKSSGKPIFVLMHQPLNYTHAVGDNKDNNGFSNNETSKKLQAILDKYENVFYLSGHQHYGLNDGSSAYNYPYGFTTVEHVGENITSVNLPSFIYPSMIYGGDPLAGDGLVLNIYADRVELLGRNFIAQGWLDYTATVTLKSAAD